MPLSQGPWPGTLPPAGEPWVCSNLNPPGLVPQREQGKAGGRQLGLEGSLCLPPGTGKRERQTEQPDKRLPALKG